MIDHVAPVQFFSLLMLHGYLEWSGLYPGRETASARRLLVRDGGGPRDRDRLGRRAARLPPVRVARPARRTRVGRGAAAAVARRSAGGGARRGRPPHPGRVRLGPRDAAGALRRALARRGGRRRAVVGVARGPVAPPHAELHAAGCGGGGRLRRRARRRARPPGADPGCRPPSPSRGDLAAAVGLTGLHGLLYVVLFKNAAWHHDYWQFFLGPFVATSLAALAVAAGRAVAARAPRLGPLVVAALLVLPLPWAAASLRVLRGPAAAPRGARRGVHAASASSSRGASRSGRRAGGRRRAETIGSHTSRWPNPVVAYYADRPLLYSRDAARGRGQPTRLRRLPADAPGQQAVGPRAGDGARRGPTRGARRSRPRDIPPGGGDMRTTSVGCWPASSRRSPARSSSSPTTTPSGGRSRASRTRPGTSRSTPAAT